MNIDVQIRQALTALDNLPKHADGRIDYSAARTSLILVCFVMHGDDMLLLKRAEGQDYGGAWSTVVGYIDSAKPFVDRVTEKLQQEIGLDHAYVESFRTGIPHRVDDEALQKTWIVVPARVELAEKREPKLDAEHTEYRWAPQAELASADVVPSLALNFEAVRTDKEKS